MLTRVEIHHYRSCAQVVLDPVPPVMALVGRNAAGKTNILRAIEWAARVATSKEVVNAEFDAATRSPATVAIDMTLNGRSYRYQVTQTLQPEPSGEREFLLDESLEVLGPKGRWLSLLKRTRDRVQVEKRISLRIGLVPALPALAALLPAEEAELTQSLEAVATFLKGIRYYPLDEPSYLRDPSAGGAIRRDVYLKWLAQQQTSPVDDEIATPMKILHLSLEQPDQVAEFKALLGPNGLNLFTDINTVGFDLGKSQPQPEPLSVRPAEDTDPTTWFYFQTFVVGTAEQRRVFAYSQLSAGTRRIMHLVASLIYDRSTVMLIEQPEDSIHPGLVRRIIGILGSYANPLTVVMASHSPTVFNALSAEAIRLVTMNQGVTQVRALSPTELGAAERFMEREGSLSDFIESMEDV